MTPLMLALLLIPAAPEPAAQRPSIGPADVVFMYSAREPEQYETYRATVAGWGGRPPSRGDAAVESFRERVEAARSRGAKYCGSVDFLVDFGGFIDFRPDAFMEAVTRDLDGEPLRVPWLWDLEHKGHPAYWFCTNNPDYRAYLLDQAERAALAPIDGLHIDDYSGSSASSAYNGGCFCEHCMEGFREWLAENVPQNKLKDSGVEDVSVFDYQAFLREKGFTAETYKSRHWEVPMIDWFQRFQNGRMKERILSVYERAESLRGKPLLRSINSNASSPRTLVPAPLIDYFCGEVHHHAEGGAGPLEPVFVFKVTEALGRRQTATASGQDWAWIKANEKPGLVQTWIAQAYAFGGVFMVPHNQWCYTQELGTHWWHGKPEDFAPIYRFIRERADWFEGYETHANAALLYSENDYGAIRDAARELASANVPFRVIVTHHYQLETEAAAQGLAECETVFAGPNDIEALRRDLGHIAKTEIKPWTSLEDAPNSLTAQVQTEPAGGVRVSLRKNPAGGSAVVHVLNQAYDTETDAVTPMDITVTLKRSLLPADGEPTGRAAGPWRKTEAIPVETGPDSIRFTVPNAGLWTVVRLR